MNLRHIDPRSSDWMDAMMMEGEGGRTRKREPQEVVEAQGAENPALLLQAEVTDGEAPRSPPRISSR